MADSVFDIPVGDVDGVETTFPFVFTKPDSEAVGYLRTEDVKVYEQVGGVFVLTTLAHTVSVSTIIFTVAPTAATVFRVQRESPRDEVWSTFARGTDFTPDQVKKTFLNLLYALQEVPDQNLPDILVGSWTPVLTGATGASIPDGSFGYWIKNDNVVTLTFFAGLNASGGLGTIAGALQVTGIPWDVVTLSGYKINSQLQFENFVIHTDSMSMKLASAGVGIQLEYGFNSKTAVDAAWIDETSAVWGTITYVTDDLIINAGATTYS